MDLQQSITEMIDLRSFSNLWFWIALAVMWSTAAHWVLGVPYDMVVRAKRRGGQSQRDLTAMVRINVNRILFVVDASGTWLVGLAFFGLTSLALLGFVYWIEFAQAVFLLLAPMLLVAALSVRSARKLRASDMSDQVIHRRLSVHRVIVQAIGLVSIFVTALFGMYQNFATGAI